MKRTFSLAARAAAVLLALNAVFSAAAEPARPEWVDNWRQLYPDETYIAQLGTASGKKNADESRNAAANNVARYINATVRSSTQGSSKFVTQTTENGTAATSVEKQLSHEITVSVDLTVTSLEFTEPWYGKKEKTWYCVAYVLRSKLWESYRPSMQNARDRLFSFYELSEKSQEPLYRMIFYKKSKKYEKEFSDTFLLLNVISPSLTEESYGKDRRYISSIDSKIAAEKALCTFAVSVSGDFQGLVYQCIKDELSNAGYAVSNGGTDALYRLNAAVRLESSTMDSLHRVKPSVEISIEGRDSAVFSYAKQAPAVAKLNEDIAKTNAARLLSEEIHKSFINEFNEKTNTVTSSLLNSAWGI